MKWILLAMMSASSGTGPMVPVFVSAEFQDRPACENAAKTMNDVSQRWRVRDMAYSCVPTASNPG